MSQPRTPLPRARNLVLPASRADYWRMVASSAARPLRFGIMGLATAVVQLGLLTGFKELGLGSIAAYALAMAIAVQFNFLTNQLFVWQDRPRAGPRLRAYVERWGTFHACIAFSLAVNMGAFVLARLFMPDLAAAVVGIGSSTLIKFLSLDRLAFRQAAP